jgi:hypothetical protein
MEPRIASRRATPAAVAIAACTWLGPALVAAQTPAAAAPDHSASAAERAQQLFDEARTLMKAEQFAEACEKLAESQRLDPGGGTLLNLGICRLRQGLTATAFQLLTEALAEARAAGRADRIATAERYLAEVTPLLSRIVLEPPARGLPEGTLVELDGTRLAPEALAAPLPLDPGGHELRVSRAGYVSYSVEVPLGPNGDLKHVALPELSPEPAPRSAPTLVAPAVLPAPASQVAAPDAPAAPPRERPTPPVAYALLAGGGAAIIAGSYFGAQAIAHKNDSDRHFDGTHCTAPSCVDDWNQAKHFALASSVSFAVGLAATGTGLYLLLARRPPRPSSAARVDVTLVVHGGAAFASASGRF